MSQPPHRVVLSTTVGPGRLLPCRLKQAGERVHIMEVSPAAENIARLIFEFVADRGSPVIDETGTSYAGYRP